MTTEELVTMATNHGVAIGQASLSAYILREYEGALSQELELLLSKVSQMSYDVIGQNLNQAGEDIAVQVDKMVRAKLG